MIFPFLGWSGWSCYAPVILGKFIYMNFQCEVPAPRCIYSHTGVQKIPVGSSQAYMSACLSVYLSFSLSLCPVFRVSFWRSKRAAHKCAQRMRMQATGTNPLSGSIIFPYIRTYIHLSGFLQAFCKFCIYINFQC